MCVCAPHLQVKQVLASHGRVLLALALAKALGGGGACHLAVEALARVEPAGQGVELSMCLGAC